MACSLTVVLMPVALAQIPPGYEIIYLDTGRPFHRNARINNLGHIVFQASSDPNNGAYNDVFYYADGRITQLTSDPPEHPVSDAMPDINDSDTIVWCREDGPGQTFQIVRCHGATGSDFDWLTDDPYGHWSPSINDLGQIVWYQWLRRGCGNAESNIQLFDAGTLRTIAADGLSNSLPKINQSGDVVWNRLNFCNQPWTSDIRLYTNGQTMTLTTGQFEPEVPGLSDDLTVAWFHHVPPDNHHAIQRWYGGVTTTLTDWGSGLRMNGRGDIAFDRWHDTNTTWQSWLYLRGRLYQLTRNDYWNAVDDINDRGEVVFTSGVVPTATRIGFLRRRPLGDLNCDGHVDNLDIDAFVLALVDRVEYEAALPECDALLADTNSDGRTDAFDVDPFVAILVSAP